MTARVFCHVVVRGRVQGVGYRAFVEHQALRVGVEGWVRNRSDDTVEAVFVGAPEIVEVVIAACRRGPHAARVDALDERQATSAEFALRLAGEMFSVLPTE